MKNKFLLRIKKRVLLDRSPARSAYHLSQLSGITKPTATRYVHHPEEIKAFDAETLGTLLTQVAGSPENVLDLRIGDIFDIYKRSDPQIE